MAIDTGTETGTFRVKSGLAQMLKGGVIMDVVTPEHAKIAEDAGACAVMALERVPSDIRADGGVARMSDPTMISGIIGVLKIRLMMYMISQLQNIKRNLGLKLILLLHPKC